MDVLEGGRERDRSRRELLPRSVHPAPVAVLLALVLLAGLVAAGPVRRAEQLAAAEAALDVQLDLVAAQRSEAGELYGLLEVWVDLPDGATASRPVLRVPGLRVAPWSGTPYPDVVGGRRAVARFVVPVCRELDVPGELLLTVVRPGERPLEVRREVVAHPPGRGEVGVGALAARCGQVLGG